MEIAINAANNAKALVALTFAQLGLPCAVNYRGLRESVVRFRATLEPLLKGESADSKPMLYAYAQFQREQSWVHKFAEVLLRSNRIDPRSKELLNQVAASASTLLEMSDSFVRVQLQNINCTGMLCPIESAQSVHNMSGALLAILPSK